MYLFWEQMLEILVLNQLCNGIYLKFRISSYHYLFYNFLNILYITIQTSCPQSWFPISNSFIRINMYTLISRNSSEVGNNQEVPNEAAR